MFAPSKRIAGGGEVAETSIEFQLNAFAGDTENEFAKSTVIVLPSAVLLLQVVITEGFDGLAKAKRGSIQFVAVPGDLLEFNGGRAYNAPPPVSAGMGLYVLDLAAITFAVECCGNQSYPGCGERLENGSFVQCVRLNGGLGAKFVGLENLS